MIFRKTVRAWIGVAAFAALAFAAIAGGQRVVVAAGGPAPEFTHTDAEDWINSGPLQLVALRGQVVLIDFWTFDCWNCYRSFPWLNELDARYRDRGLRVIGVHSPEFAHERERERVLAKVREFGLYHPVMIDNDFSYWQAMNNRYWPAFYLIDTSGQVADVFVGETHSGDDRAKRIEARIQALLPAKRPSRSNP